MPSLRIGRPPRWLVATAVAGAAAGAAVAGQAVISRRWAGRSVDQPDSFLLPGIEHLLASHDGGTVFAIESAPGDSVDGPTVVLCHGIAGDVSHWTPVAHRLVVAGCRVVVFDQRGHGRSLAGSEGYSLAGMAHDVAAVITELGGANTLIVAGHSLGGVGLQALGRKHPDVLERIDGMALVATLPHTIGGPLAQVLGSPLALRAYRRLMRKASRARLAMRAGFGTTFTLEMLDQLSLTWANATDEALVGFGRALGQFSVMPDLELIRTPIVVVCGTRDSITPMNLSVKISNALPNATLVRVPDAGHMIVWEVPDLLADEILRLAGSAGQPAHIPA